MTDQPNWSTIRGIPVPNELLDDGDWVPGVMQAIWDQWAAAPTPQFTGVLEYLKDQQ